MVFCLVADTGFGDVVPRGCMIGRSILQVDVREERVR